MPLDATFIKGQAWDYINGEKIREAVGKAGQIEWNPFEIEPETGKPKGFNKVFLSVSGSPVEIIHALLWAVEKVTVDAGEIAKGSGNAKREALVNMLDEVIRLPFFLEPFDGILIGKLIDWAIDWLNAKFGKDWINHIPAPELTKTA